MKFNWSCSCGGHWYGEVPSRAKKALLELWERKHTGPGHSPATPKQARQKRYREDRKEGTP